MIFRAKLTNSFHFYFAMSKKSCIFVFILHFLENLNTLYVTYTSIIDKDIRHSDRVR